MSHKIDYNGSFLIRPAQVRLCAVIMMFKLLEIFCILAVYNAKYPVETTEKAILTTS